MGLQHADYDASMKAQLVAEPTALASGLPDATTRSSRAWALGATWSLVLLGLAWELVLAPMGSGTLAIKVLPLLLALGGLARYRMSTFRWLSLLVWLYCLEGLLRATTEAGWSRALAAIEVGLSVVLFVACSVHIRWRLRRGQAA